MTVLVINGPNLNMLGIREPDIYGKQTYEALVKQVSDYAAVRGVEIAFFQSNHEGAIVDTIQQAHFDKVDGIIINPAAYTHTSVAILDALKAVAIPTVEVHLSDINSRDEFRKHSFVSPACVATICGKGFAGYLEALDILLK